MIHTKPQQIIQSGRYIPSQAIEDAMVRVESLLANAVEEANKNESTTAISIRTVQRSF
jgi:hypothetical protein